MAEMSQFCPKYKRQFCLLNKKNVIRTHKTVTLESVIDVGQGISVGPGRFGEKKLCKLMWEKIMHKEITMLKKKNKNKQNIQTVLVVGPRKNSKS